MTHTLECRKSSKDILTFSHVLMAESEHFLSSDFLSESAECFYNITYTCNTILYVRTGDFHFV